MLFCFCLGQVVNIPNSMTVLTDLLPVSLAMADKKLEVRTRQQHCNCCCWCY